jgi:hypothetical protein
MFVVVLPALVAGLLAVLVVLDVLDVVVRVF